MRRLGKGAMGRVVRSGVGRRRVQTVVMTLAVLMAVTSAVVAGSLMVASSAPFDDAFAAQRGAHLVVQTDDARTSAAELAATAHLSGVTASAGPYQQAVFRPQGPNGGPAMPPTTVAGRATPGGAVDDVTLESGRWVAGPGEIVLSSDLGMYYPLGSVLRVSGVANGPALTVVGVARSVSVSADGWVVPAQIGALRAVGAPATSQMLYRFASAAGTAQITADRARLSAALAPGAVVGAVSYLDTRLAATQNTELIVPIMTAFGVLGLLMSVIIISSVVSGAVGGNVRRIGILKAVGFTPGQVVRAYVAQALVPAGVGTALGLLFGNLLAVPLLSDAQQAYGTAALTVAWWVDLAVPAGALAVVALAALLPALRAGRMRTVEAIAIGRAPRAGRGQWAHRLAGRLPLPRAVTLGLASPFARPVRTAAMLAAVLFGTAAVTFAVGLTSSTSAIVDAIHPGRSSAVEVDVRGPEFGGQAGAMPGRPAVSATDADRAKLPAAIGAQPGTRSFYGRGQTTVTVAGATGPINVALYQGDSLPGAYDIISGRWFTGPGEVVVPTHFLASTGTRVGDSVTLVDQGVRIPVRIVGEDFSPGNAGMDISADLATFAAAEPGLQVFAYHLTLNPGVSAADYITALNTTVEPLGAEASGNMDAGLNKTAVLIDAMAGLLTLMLVTVAGLGVLNSVVLDTRERVHDLGVCKAVGMSPRQTVTQVVTSVLGVGLLGGLAGVPAGTVLHHLVIRSVVHSWGSGMPAQLSAVYHSPELILLTLAGATIAVLGALLPAGWAAKARTAVALRTE